MAEVEVYTGFKVYKYYNDRNRYHKNHLRRKRNEYVVESLFGNDEQTFPNSKTNRLLRRLNTLQQISDLFFQRIKLEPDVLEEFKNVLGASFEHGTIDYESFLSSQKSNHFRLIRLLFKTVSRNYEKILELENQVHTLTDDNFNLNAYVSDVQDEMEKLRNFASDCNELRVSELGIQSEEYQMLYESHSSLQDEFRNVLHKNYKLQKQISQLLQNDNENKKQQDNAQDNQLPLDLEQYGIDQFGDDQFQLPFDMNLFEPVVDENKYQTRLQEYEKRVGELRRSNDRLFDENIKLKSISQEVFGADKFVTLSLLFNQITKSFNKLFQDQTELDKIKAGTEGYKKFNRLLHDAAMNTLEYENKTYKEKLAEFEELLKLETMGRFSLESIVSQLKMELHQSQQVYLKLESLNTSVLTNEHELDLMRTNRDVLAEQLSRMKHMVTSLTHEKNDLSSKIFELEYSKDSLLKEIDVLKDQMKKLESLLIDQTTDRFDFKDKINNIQLQANSKILEDKLLRIKIKLDEVQLENTNLVTNTVDLKNNLERVRRENSDLTKKISVSLDNESKLTTEIQHIMNEVNGLKASLETGSLNLRNMSNDMGLMTRKLFEKDLQLSSLEAKKDMATTLLNEFAAKLNACKMNSVNLEELKNIDVKTMNYNELVQMLTSAGNSKNLVSFSSNSTTNEADTIPLVHSNTDFLEESLNRNLTNLINFNEFLSVLCVNLAKQLGTLTNNMLNVTNFSNIYETFKVELVDVDMFKNECLVKISDLESKISNLEKLNAELGGKHVWEKSVVRMKENYETSLSNYKLMLKECRHLLKLNENALDSLRNENSRLLSDCSGAANVMVEYENKLADSTNELVHLKELIFTLLPTELKINASRETPLKSIELLSNYLNNINIVDVINSNSNLNAANFANLANNYAVGSRANDYKSGHAVNHQPNTNRIIDLDNSNATNRLSSKNEDFKSTNQKIVNSARINTNRDALTDKDQLLSYTQQQLDDIYDDVNYYCKIILTEIKSQLNADKPMDTDYESTNDNHESGSDDTLSDYKDEDYVVDKFEEILNLLNKLYYHNNYANNRQTGSKNRELYHNNVGAVDQLAMFLDINVIKSINKFVLTLKRYYVSYNKQNMFVLDDLEYQFESLATIMDSESKFKTFANNLIKLLNLAGDFIYDQLSENSENMNHMIKQIQDNSDELQKLEHMNMSKDQQIKSTQFELNDLKLELEHLQQMYINEKNRNQEMGMNVNKYENEMNRLRQELAENTKKSEKLLFLVQEYQEIVKLLKS